MHCHTHIAEQSHRPWRYGCCDWTRSLWPLLAAGRPRRGCRKGDCDWAQIRSTSIAGGSASGASETIDADATDPVEAVRHITKGVGADLVIEAAADSDAVPQALKMVRQGGTVIMAGSGYKGKPVTFEPWNIVRDEITIRGTEGFTKVDYLNALNLLSTGKLDVKPIVTHEMPLAQINEACELVNAKQVIKVVLTLGD